LFRSSKKERFAMSAPIPVICDRCRAEGVAGDPQFSAIADILDFEPVQRRARADGWSAEYQRAFIAALAITGAPRRAARAIGKHAFGAEQLRKARGARSFAAAWDAALEIYRDREAMRLKDNMAELAREQEQRGELNLFAGDVDPDDPEAIRQQQYEEASERIRDKLLRSRRLYLEEICEDPAKRAAWEVLTGPVDWDKARRLEPQDNEPFPRPDEGVAGIPNCRKPDMLLTAEGGWLAEATGGRDRTGELRREIEAIMELRSLGYRVDGAGNLHAPPPEPGRTTRGILIQSMVIQCAEEDEQARPD
jgi:hypothetical protein